MTDVLGKILETKSTILIVLGAVFILGAAVNVVPVSGQTNLSVEPAWRYFIATTGAILLVIGLVLIWKEPGRSVASKSDRKAVEKLDDKEIEQYLFRRLREAKKSVSDLTYEDFSRDAGKAILFFTPSDREEYLHIVETISKQIKYREIIMFDGRKTRISKARRLVAHAGKYYQLAGFTDLPQGAPPRHNFIIIDDEVILKGMVIRQADIVDYFRNLYDEIWQAAQPIKVSTELDLALIETAERKLAETDKPSSIPLS